MGVVTRWFCLTKARLSLGMRLGLAGSTLMLGLLGLAARADAYIYFGNTGTKAVARADANFTTLAFIAGGRDGVAVDSNYIYFSDSLAGTLRRAKLVRRACSTTS